MDTSRIKSVAELRNLTCALEPVDLQSASIENRYQFLEDTARKFRYASLRLTKKAKREIISFCVKVTGLSRPQVKRLLCRFVKTGHVLRQNYARHKFPTFYTTDDVALLVKADNASLRLAGPSMVHTFWRMSEVYGKVDYERLSKISVSHLYNLRDTRQYQSHSLTIGKTNPVSIPIGKRMRPQTGGKPGYIRVDTVHQGDLGKVKGVYYINLVDEVTQWEVVACISDISEMCLEPVLDFCLRLFPFHILGFHSDNGGEYINYTVASLLSKIKAKQTKSRSRRTNDNALVEGKNVIIRKHFGYVHIPKKFAGLIDCYLKDWLTPYLNFHRPCAFATDYVNPKGKVKKKYDKRMTPFEKLKNIPNVEKYLRLGMTIASLEKEEHKMDDVTFAELKEIERGKLFKSLSKC